MLDVARWLAEQGLGHHAEAFAENGIAGDILRELTDADLKELGLNLGDRKRLLKSIAALAAGSTDARAETPNPTVAPAVPREAERRQLTVLFCDLVGSTELAAQLDPEDMAQVIRAYHACCAAVIGRWGGHVAKYMGDGVLAYFGWPTAHEDEAERAVRAGLAIVDALVGLETPAGTPLAARIGIATGMVMVGELIGEGAAKEHTVVGETPNLAARLQTLAAPGSVVISQATRRLVGRLFVLADLGPQRLKGFAEALAAWRVEGEGRAEGRFEALRGERLTPLVGREHELGILLERWAWARDGDGQVVLLSGEPGIGKSRLIRAVRERLGDEPYTPLSHYCSPYHTNSALYPVIGLLERAARLDRDDPPEEQLAKLEALLARTSDGLDEVVPLIAALLGIPTGECYPALILTPEVQKRRTLEALVDQLAALAAQQPVLALYEDVHWIDPSTLELLGLVTERIRRLPVLMLITFRPEFQPPWTGQAHVTTLTMNRLGRRQGADLVARVSRDKPLPAEVIEQILARTDGVPLFVEELTKTVLESGLLREQDGTYVLNGPLPSLAIPSTLHDSLMARLDRLAPVREVAQTAACIGREFSHALLAAISPLPEPELAAALDQLIDFELVFRRGTPPDATYVFKHALVQDAAYESLLKSRRQQIHAHIARCLEERFLNIVESEPELVAHHYTCAGFYECASDCWRRAGLRNTSRSAYVEATSHLKMALETGRKLPRTLRHQEKELEIRSLLASALRVTKGHVAEELEDMLEQMLKLAEELGRKAESSHALNGLSLVHLNRGELTQARAHAIEALTRAVEAGERACELLARRTIGTVKFLLGELPDARAELHNCLDLYTPEHDRTLIRYYSFDPFVASHGFLSWSYWILGYPDSARQHLRAGHTYASELQHGYSLIFSHLMAAVLYLMLREPGPSQVHAEAAISLSAEQRLPYFSSIAKACQGWAQARGGHVASGLSRLREGLEAHQAVPWEPLMHCSMAEILMAARRADEALACLAGADLIVEQTGASWWAAEIQRTRGVALLSLPMPDAARAASSFEAALERARSQQAMSWELRASTSLARLWGEQGRRAEAQDLLARVYGWFTEGFDTADLKEARALLDELA